MTSMLDHGGNARFLPIDGIVTEAGDIEAVIAVRGQHENNLPRQSAE